MLKLFIYAVLIALTVILIRFAVKTDSTGKKTVLGIVSGFCILIFLIMLSCQPILKPSVIKNEIRSLTEIKIPKPLKTAVDESDTVEIFGEEAQMSELIITGSPGDAGISSFCVKGYRFKDEKTAEKLAESLMTDSDFEYGELGLIMQIGSESYNVSGFYDYDTPEQKAYYIDYLKNEPPYFAKKIKTVGDTNIYSTPTALPIWRDSEAVAFNGRIWNGMYHTIFAVQQGEYVYVFSEVNYSILRDSSRFGEWLEESQDWIMNGKVFESEEDIKQREEWEKKLESEEVG